MTDLGKCDCGCWDYQQLKAENERLRGVLADIAIIGVGNSSARVDALEMQRLAHKALGKATD